MKRILFSMAIVAVAASCSQNEVFDIAQTNVIGFSTLNDRVTKAANDNDDDYKVYAAISTSEVAWYIDDYVSCGSSESATTAEVGSYYWPILSDATPTLDFCAYAPYDVNSEATTGITVTETEATGVKIDYVVPTNAQEDFTVAAPIKEKTTSSYADGVVPFTFAHMLAKVTIELDLEESFGEVYEISESYSGADDAPFTATFTPTKDKFTLDNILDNNTAIAADATDATTAITSPEESEATTYSKHQSYMIAPQPFADCVLQINGITIRHKATGTLFFANVGVDLTELTLDGSELDGSDATFDAGKHYVFTVVISGASTDDDEDTEDPVEITFSATTTDWNADDDDTDYETELEQVEDEEA